MGFLLTSITVVGSTAIWLVNRWVIHGGGRGQSYGFWSAATSAVVSGLVLLALRQSPLDGAVWSIGAMIAFGYAIGYFMVIMHCMRIGPIGPTVAMNNMGMVWPVVLGVLWLKPRPVGAPMILGFVMVCLSLILVGLSKRGPNHKRLSSAWPAWAFLGWVLSGVALTGQLLGSVHSPEKPVALVFALNILTAAFLAPLVLRSRSGWFGPREFVGGIVNGVIVAISNVALLMALNYVGPEVVFPFTIALPIVLVAALGQILYHEKLDRLAWTASVLAVLGLAGLARL